MSQPKGTTIDPWTTISVNAPSEFPIEFPTENDVLFGRGAPFIRWKGNVQFRQVVSKWKSKYLETRRHDEKSLIARKIIDEIRVNRRGRFLIKYDPPGDVHGSRLSTDLWVPADENLTVEKVKQTLRDRNPRDAQGEKMDRQMKRKAADRKCPPGRSQQMAKLSPTRRDEVPAHGYSISNPSDLTLNTLQEDLSARVPRRIGEDHQNDVNSAGLGGHSTDSSNLIHRDTSYPSTIGTLGVQLHRPYLSEAAMERELLSHRLELLRRSQSGSLYPSSSDGRMISANSAVNSPSYASSLTGLLQEQIALANREQQILQHLSRIQDTQSTTVRGADGVTTRAILGYYPLSSLNDSLLSVRNPRMTATSVLSSLPTLSGTVYDLSAPSPRRFASGLNSDFNAHSLHRLSGHLNERRSFPPGDSDNEAKDVERPPQQE